MTTLARTISETGRAALAVGYQAHPATQPPGAEFAAFHQPELPQPRFWPPVWDGAARLRPLPAALDHPVAEPRAPEPVAIAPTPAEADTVEPAAADADLAEPVVAAPAVTEPAVTEPAVIHPVIAEPVAVQPISAAPAPPVQTHPAQARRRRRLLWPALGVAACVLALAVGLAAWRHQPAAKVELAATFKAPVLVLRASRPGMIQSFAVKPGEHVAPATVLLTLQIPPAPDPMALAAGDRVAVAQRRLDTLQTAAQQPIPQTAANRARLNDLHHQLDQAEFDLAAAQDALARLTPPDPAEMPIVAGAHGVVLSLEAAQGTQASAGTPLIRMADCDHGYMALDGPASLDPGSLVEVHVAEQPPVPATLQPASRVSGPIVAMIAVPAPGAFAQACPLGAAGTVSPIPPAG